MTPSHKKPGVAFWATVVVVVVLVAYPLSFGPACWVYPKLLLPPIIDQALHRIYAPLANHALNGEKNPDLLSKALWEWSILLGGNGAWIFATDPKIYVAPH